MSEVTEKTNQEVDEKKKKEVVKKETAKKDTQKKTTKQSQNKITTNTESKTKSKPTGNGDTKTTGKSTKKTSSSTTKSTAKTTAKATTKKTANTTKSTTKSVGKSKKLKSEATKKTASNLTKTNKAESENKDISKQTKKDTNQRKKEVINKEDLQSKEKNENKKNAKIQSEDKIKEPQKAETKINEIIENEETNPSSNQSTDESKYDTISLKEIREAIENKVDKTQKKSIIKETLINIGIAVLMIIYFAIVIMGSKNIDAETFEKDLKIMTLGILAVGIVILEISYKKDKSKIALIGVETLVFGAANLCIIYIAKLHMDQLVKIINYIGIVIAGYYIFKSIVLAITNISRFKKDNSDIKDIVTKKKQVEEE